MSKLFTVLKRPFSSVPRYRQIVNRERSLRDRERFWMQAQREIEWIKRPSRALDMLKATPHKPHWFPDGRLNISFNALDRHVRDGRANQLALIYDSPATSTIRKYTYSELLELVQRAATMLKDEGGVRKGDRVLIYMGAVPEAIVGMLACARLGAVHSVVFGGFAAGELAKRIEDCRPRVVLASSCGVEGKKKVVAYKPLLDGALKLCRHKPNKVVVLQRPELRAELAAGEVGWQESVVERTDVYQGYAEVGSNDPLYILYTSGTTGTPKGVVRPSGPHAVVLTYTMNNMYSCRPGQVYWAASDLGWILGHSYICYGPLLNGSTTVLYEGKPVGTPDPGAFFRVMAEHKVDTFFTAPTALMILRREDPQGVYRKRYEIGNTRTMFLAGERCPPEIHKWWVKLITGVDDTGKPEHRHERDGTVVSDNWWQTESGSPWVGLEAGLETDRSKLPPIKYGSAGLPVQGVDLRVLRIKDALDEEMEMEVDADPVEASAGEVGNIVLKLPLPPGNMTSLWEDDERYFNAYFRRFPGYYDTGDTGMVDSDGYVHILSRADDIINVAAHRISTSAIEEVVVEHKGVAECCVVSRPHPIKGSVPVVIAVCKQPDDNIREEIVKEVRQRVGAFVSLYRENFVFVQRLPKTRSGKVLRKMVRSMILALIEGQGEEVSAPATIEEVAVKDEIWESLKKWIIK